MPVVLEAHENSHTDDTQSYSSGQPAHVRLSASGGLEKKKTRPTDKNTAAAVHAAARPRSGTSTQPPWAYDPVSMCKSQHGLHGPTMKASPPAEATSSTPWPANRSNTSSSPRRTEAKAAQLGKASQKPGPSIAAGPSGSRSPTALSPNPKQQQVPHGRHGHPYGPTASGANLSGHGHYPPYMLPAAHNPSFTDPSNAKAAAMVAMARGSAAMHPGWPTAPQAAGYPHASPHMHPRPHTATHGMVALPMGARIPMTSHTNPYAVMIPYGMPMPGGISAEDYSRFGGGLRASPGHAAVPTHVPTQQHEASSSPAQHEAEARVLTPPHARANPWHAQSGHAQHVMQAGGPTSHHAAAIESYAAVRPLRIPRHLMRVPVRVNSACACACACALFCWLRLGISTAFPYTRPLTHLHPLCLGTCGPQMQAHQLAFQHHMHVMHAARLGITAGPTMHPVHPNQHPAMHPGHPNQHPAMSAAHLYTAAAQQQPPYSTVSAETLAASHHEASARRHHARGTSPKAEQSGKSQSQQSAQQRASQNAHSRQGSPSHSTHSTPRPRDKKPPRTSAAQPQSTRKIVKSPSTSSSSTPNDGTITMVQSPGGERRVVRTAVGWENWVLELSAKDRNQLVKEIMMSTTEERALKAAARRSKQRKSQREYAAKRRLARWKQGKGVKAGAAGALLCMQQGPNRLVIHDASSNAYVSGPTSRSSIRPAEPPSPATRTSNPATTTVHRGNNDAGYSRPASSNDSPASSPELKMSSTASNKRPLDSDDSSDSDSNRSSHSSSIVAKKFKSSPSTDEVTSKSHTATGATKSSFSKSPPPGTRIHFLHKHAKVVTA